MSNYCRFNPTANGPLHLGHLFTLLVNEYQAHTTGGSFYVRFDDTSPVPLSLGDRRYDIIEGQIDDINWFDLPVDGYFYQSDQLEEVHQRLAAKGWKTMTDTPEGQHYLPHAVRMGTDWAAYPYVPQQTAERVIHDEMIGVNYILRGDDFLTEFGEYYLICDLLHVPRPKMDFLPRLDSIKGDISKTNGGYTINEFRQLGYSPKDVIAALTKACLIYPANGWELYNLRRNPRLQI